MTEVQQTISFSKNYKIKKEELKQNSKGVKTEKKIVSNDTKENDERILKIKEIIEHLDQSHHVEILRILKKHSNVVINENNNGIFINITNLDIHIIEEIENYINYINVQMNNLNEIENKKENFINEFFNDKSS